MARAAAGKPAAGGSNYPVLRDKAVMAAVEEYCTKKAEMDALKERVDALRDIILAAMAGSPTAYCGARVLSVSQIPELPAIANREITKAMVGQVIPGKKGRAGYAMLRVQ